MHKSLCWLYFIMEKEVGHIKQDAISELEVEKASLLNLLAQTNLFDSKGEIRRLIKQGAMKLDGERVDDPEILICFEGNEDQKVVKAGKKIFLRFKS